MNKYTKFGYKLLSAVFYIFANLHWQGLKALFNGGLYYNLREEDHNNLRRLLAKDYYLIVTRKNCHLSTWLILLGGFFLRFKLEHYVHALMNVDDGNIQCDSDFRLMEATNSGVHYSTFMQVFDCDSVCLLKPKHFSAEDWTKVLDRLLELNGRPYDNLFDFADDSHLSCIEVVRTALMAHPNYEAKFEAFEGMVKKYKKITAQMLYDCPDFEIVFEVRR